MCLYKKAMSLEENNKYLLENGYPAILQDDEGYTDFSKPVPLFGITNTKNGPVIEEHLFKKRGGRDYWYNPEKGEGYYIADVFASREFAQAVIDRINFIMDKKVIYKNKEHYVHDCLDSRQVGIHEKEKDVTIYDLLFVPVDELELADEIHKKTESQNRSGE